MFGDSYGFGKIMATATGKDIFEAMGIAAESIGDDDGEDAPLDYDEWGNPVADESQEDFEF